jgi:hypothetical protein
MERFVATIEDQSVEAWWVKWIVNPVMQVAWNVVRSLVRW